MEEKFFQEVLKVLKRSTFVTTEKEILEFIEKDVSGFFSEWLLKALEIHLYSGGRFIVDAETKQPLNSDFVRKVIIKIKVEKMTNITWVNVYDKNDIGNVFFAPHTLRIVKMSKSTDIYEKWQHPHNIHKVKDSFVEKVEELFGKDEKFMVFAMPTSKETFTLFIQPLLESVLENYSNAVFPDIFHKKDDAIQFGSDEFKKMSYSDKKKQLKKIILPTEIDTSITRALIIDDVCSSGESIKFLERLIKENFKNVKEVNAVVFLKIEADKHKG